MSVTTCTLRDATTTFSPLWETFRFHAEELLRETLHRGTTEFAFQCVQLKISVTVTAIIPYLFIHWCFYCASALSALCSYEELDHEHDFE
jgi:hypothetical protein